jgi:3-oxoacyl-[acyl-carrier protein] reductase
MIDLGLKNKKIILTGGSRGIGLSILNKLYSLEAKILIIGTNKEKLELVKKKYQEIQFEAFDLSNHDQINSLFERCIKKLGGLDILINNAGITKDNLAIRMNKSEWSDVININLTSSFLMCQEAIKVMLKNKSGSIINITSIVAHLGNAGQVNYASSKAALIGMSKSLAREYAKKNIRVNCISPGFIQSDMTSVLKDEQKSLLKNTIPMEKIGSGVDVANGVVFLASNMSNYITGETLHINGGMYMS